MRRACSPPAACHPITHSYTAPAPFPPPTPSGAVYVNAAPIVKPDITAGKAVVHELDGILLPPELADLLASGATASDPAASDAAAGDFAAYAASPAPASAVTADATVIDAAASDAAAASPASDAAAAGTAAAGASGSDLTTTTGGSAAPAQLSGAVGSAVNTLGLVALALPALLALLY
jgi:hypothetical protein